MRYIGLVMYSAEFCKSVPNLYDYYTVYLNSNKLAAIFPIIYIVYYDIKMTYFGLDYIDTILPMDINNPDETINKFNSLFILK
jgi:hypothetical protein